MSSSEADALQVYRSALRRAADRLERGSVNSVAAALLAGVWERCSNPVRPVVLPHEARVIGVGGATLGGSGKTPIVLELARRLCQSPGGCAVVASGYRARLRSAVRVSPRDRAGDVGDEALLLARGLSEWEVPVFVGRSRNAALAMAARAAGTVLVDGLLQTRPTPVGSALLVLDGRAPWGAGRCPPAGDLRASTSRLLAACDAILLRDYEGDEQVADVVRHSGKPVYRWSSRITCAVDHGGRRADLEELRRLKLGVIFGLARPDRQLSDLSELGLRPAQVHLYSDHESPSETKLGRLASGLDGWLTSSKCATKLRPTIGGRKVWILRQEIGLPDALMGALRATGDVPEGRGFTRHQPW